MSTAEFEDFFDGLQAGTTSAEIGLGEFQVKVEQSLQIFDNQISSLGLDIEQKEIKSKLDDCKIKELFASVDVKEGLKEKTYKICVLPDYFESIENICRGLIGGGKASV